MASQLFPWTTISGVHSDCQNSGVALPWTNCQVFGVVFQPLCPVCQMWLRWLHGLDGHQFGVAPLFLYGFDCHHLASLPSSVCQMWLRAILRPGLHGLPPILVSDDPSLAVVVRSSVDRRSMSLNFLRRCLMLLCHRLTFRRRRLTMLHTSPVSLDFLCWLALLSSPLDALCRRVTLFVASRSRSLAVYH